MSLYMYVGESVTELCEQTVCTVGIGNWGPRPYLYPDIPEGLGRGFTSFSSFIHTE